MDNLVAIGFVFGFFGLIGLVTAALAVRKGYQFLPWFFAGGIIGLLFLCFLPFANDPKLSEMEQRSLAEKGNVTGKKIAVVSLGLVLLRMVMS